MSKTLHVRDVNCPACFEACGRDWETFASCGQHGTFEPIPMTVVRSDVGVVRVEVAE